MTAASDATRTSRRNVLRLLGGGTLVLGAGLGGWAATRDPAAARAPWAAAAHADPRLHALGHAVLAPNPHNRQPWLLALHGDDALSLHVDLDRRLPHTDPFDRQIVIGLGCFLETLAIAAADRGLHARITAFPEGAAEGAQGLRLDARPVAHVRLTPGAARDPLFDRIPHRRSCKEPFADRPVPAETLAALREAVPGLRTEADPARVAALRDLAWRAHQIESETPRTMKESVDLMRFGRRQIEASPDGIDLGGAFLEGLWRLGQLSPDALMDPNSAAFAQGLDMYRAIFAATPNWVWLAGPATRAGEIAAGRDWMRLNLAANAAGIDLHPVSQALQEFPEMADLFAEAHALLGVDPASGRRVHMLGRLGYGPAVPASPRWPLETRMLPA